MNKKCLEVYRLFFNTCEHNIASLFGNLKMYDELGVKDTGLEWIRRYLVKACPWVETFMNFSCKCMTLYKQAPRNANQLRPQFKCGKNI